ncbi:MAG: glycosyltransferase family 2 protein [Candidatus Omnitrophica bacterium]|nr:glycosyltransferase family 2 protein [Candidatus Omnitrophota bacterium]
MTLEKYPYVIIIIPAHNEEASIANVIKKIQENYITKNKTYWVEIIVVDDGSSDNTVKVTKESGVNKIISHIKNRGLGAATRIGLQRAYEMGADVAVKIDADFQHDPNDIDKLVQPILEDKADCVFGSRFSGGLKYTMPFYRAIGNRFFSYLVSKLTGLKITDAQTGLMAFRKRYLKDFEMISDYNETQQLIMDANSKHMRIIETPVVFYKRKSGKSFISWRYPIKVVPTMIRFFYYANPLKVFLPLGIFLIAAGITLGIKIMLGGEGFFGDATISILVIGGIQTILFGMLADIIGTKR